MYGQGERMIGLQRGTVQVVPYDPNWPVLFEQEKQRLHTIFGDADIQHIGSTAVPGLAAKPLIDIMVAVGRLADFKRYIEPLQKNGYEFMPERVFKDRIFLPKGPREQRVYHLSLVEKGSAQWVQTLRFRDYLRTHAEARTAYQVLKQELAQRYANNRAAYTQAKEAFIANSL